MVSYISGRTRRTLSDAEIVALYVGGLDSETIGARANCNATAVLDIVRAAGETVRPRGGRPRGDLHAITDADICQRYAQGWSGPRIAQAANCNVSSVYNILRRCGVPLRKAADAIAAEAARTRALRRTAQPRE
jgi:hypothetical protein